MCNVKTVTAGDVSHLHCTPVTMTNVTSNAAQLHIKTVKCHCNQALVILVNQPDSFEMFDCKGMLACWHSVDASLLSIC